MRLKLLLLAGVLILNVPLQLRAQTDSTMSFSLAEAQQYALENFYVSKNAVLDIENSKKIVSETRAIGLPQIMGAVDYSYIPEIPTIELPGAPPIEAGLHHNLSYNLVLSQLIFSGEYIVALQASRSFMKLSEEAYEKTAIELKAMIAGTYYAILIFEKNVELLDSTLQNLEKIYLETKAACDQGLMDKTDADQININVTRISNTLKDIKRQKEYMHNMLKYQLGIPMNRNIQLKNGIEDLININLIQLEGNYAFVLDENIDYKMLSTQEKINTLSMNRQKSTYLPSLSGFYRYEDKAEKSNFDMTMKHMVGVSLSVPIFSSGAKQAKLSQAKIALEQSQLTKEQEAQKLIMDAEQAKFDYLSALESFENQKNNFELSDRILKNTTAKYTQGMASSMDLTLANNQFLEAQISYSSAILELFNAKTALDKAFNKL